MPPLALHGEQACKPLFTVWPPSLRERPQCGVHLHNSPRTWCQCNLFYLSMRMWDPRHLSAPSLSAAGAPSERRGIRIASFSLMGKFPGKPTTEERMIQSEWYQCGRVGLTGCARWAQGRALVGDFNFLLRLRTRRGVAGCASPVPSSTEDCDWPSWRR